MVEASLLPRTDKKGLAAAEVVGQGGAADVGLALRPTASLPVEVRLPPAAQCFRPGTRRPEPCATGVPPWLPAACSPPCLSSPAFGPTGDRYIVADCGGGTVDLTVHQIEQPQGTLKELYKASGEEGSQEPLEGQERLSQRQAKGRQAESICLGPSLAALPLLPHPTPPGTAGTLCMQLGTMAAQSKSPLPCQQLQPSRLLLPPTGVSGTFS